MLLWQDNTTDTSGEQGPADRIGYSIGTGDGKNLVPQLMDPTMPIARKGVEFYTSISNVVNQIDASIVTVDNAMQSIINTMGQGENLAAGIKKNFADAALEIIGMGGSEKEALAVQTETLEVLGRNSTLSKEQYETLFATSKVTGQSVKDLTTSLLDVGGNIDQIATDMEAVVSRSNALGVNAKAVSEKVLSNMEQMNRFGFQGGIDGLARMAAKAQVLRFDMSEVFELAEDLLSPEKAIEMASALQRLGATTTSLIDPLRLMDLAQNDVGELQNQLGELFKTYTYFDEETKKFQIMPSARRDLRQLSQDLGIPLKEIEKMALGAADLDKKMSQIDFSGLDVTDDTKELVANLSTMNKEGTYTIKNEAGVDEDLSTFIQRYADDEEGLKNFLQQQEEDAGKSAEQKMLERADAQLSSLKKIEASNEETAKALSLGIGGSEYATQLLDAQVAINKRLNAGVTEGYQDPKFLKDLQDAGKNMKEASQLISQGNLKDGMVGVLSSLKDFGKSVLTQTGDIVMDAVKDIKDLGVKFEIPADFSKSLLDALKYFENPGTLKVTMYGDKTDNTKKIENAVAEPKEIESENAENQNKLFDVSLSQLEQTINLVSLMEKMVGLSQNSNITNESSLRESVKYYSEKTASKVEGTPTTNQTFNESNNVSVLNQNFEEYIQTQKVDAENLRETFREMAEKQIQVIRENYTQTETGTFISKETGEEKTLTQLMLPVKDFAFDSLQKLLEKQSATLISFDEVVKGLEKYQGGEVGTTGEPITATEIKNFINTYNNKTNNQSIDQVGDEITSYFSSIDSSLQTAAQSLNNVNLNNVNNENNTKNVLEGQNTLINNNELEKIYTTSETFREFIELQKNEIQKTKEEINNVFLSIKENYTKTDKGTFISKETGEEKTLQQIVGSAKDIAQERIDTVMGKIYETLQEISGTKGDLGKNISVESINNITQGIFEPLKITVSDVQKIFSEKENVENNRLITNTAENVRISDVEKSITSYLNQKVQPLPGQISPEIVKILSQSNDTIVTTLSEINNTNKDTVLSTTELNKNLSDTTQIETETNDNFTKTVDNLISEDKSVTKVLENQNNTITGELFTQPQVPEYIQPTFTNYTPPDIAKVENYFRTVEEKTTNENKTEKKEQIVNFGPLKIQFDVTGVNNSQTTESILGFLKTDQRWIRAITDVVTNKRANYNLVEKLD